MHDPEDVRPIICNTVSAELMLQTALACQRLSESLGFVDLVITDGENGCYVFEHTQTTCIPAIPAPGPVDTVGAGDSFTAGFSYALAAGFSMVESAEFGNCCSAITIRKLNQTGAPSPAELQALLA